MSTVTGGSTAPVEVERPAEDEVIEPDVPWIVIVWNDPINLMSYVVFVFQKLFGYPRAQATKLMLDVHHKGKAVVASARGRSASSTSRGCTRTGCGRRCRGTGSPRGTRACATNAQGGLPRATHHVRTRGDPRRPGHAARPPARWRSGDGPRTAATLPARVRGRSRALGGVRPHGARRPGRAADGGGRHDGAHDRSGPLVRGRGGRLARDDQRRASHARGPPRGDRGVHTARLRGRRSSRSYAVYAFLSWLEEDVVSALAGGR